MSNELNSEKRHDARQRKLALERQAAADEFVIAGMGTRQGRIFFYELLATCKIGANPFNGHALITAFNCGERNIGDQLQERLTRLCPNLYIQMLQEQQELQNARPDPNTDTDSNSVTDSGPYS